MVYFSPILVWFASTQTIPTQTNPFPCHNPNKKINKTISGLVLLSRQNHTEQDRLDGPNQPYRVYQSKSGGHKKTCSNQRFSFRMTLNAAWLKTEKTPFPPQPPTDTPTSYVAKPDKLGILNVTKRAKKREIELTKPDFFQRNLKNLADDSLKTSLR